MKSAMDEDATSLFDFLTQSLFDPSPDDDLLELFSQVPLPEDFEPSEFCDGDHD